VFVLIFVTLLYFLQTLALHTNFNIVWSLDNEEFTVNDNSNGTNTTTIGDEYRLQIEYTTTTRNTTTTSSTMTFRYVDRLLLGADMVC
jgi:hypothetical protein